ncbi:hypothetical protein F4802DRAFT_557408 [Xylaria palmicola]|nr:hypothetical protein F4802DRAFT_557408 [Xylaria palmicola]
MDPIEFMAGFTSPGGFSSSAHGGEVDLALDSYPDSYPESYADYDHEASPEDLFYATMEYYPAGHGPEGTDGSTNTAQSDLQELPTKPKRKRENRYKNAPPSVLSRRRAQNRASQRAYRERKDQRIKDLEQVINDLRQKNEMLSKGIEALKTECWALRSQQQAQLLIQPSPVSWDPTLPDFGDRFPHFSDQMASYNM